MPVDILDCMEDHLAIITVFYNHYEVASDFFSSLKKQENQNFKLFVADLSPTSCHSRESGNLSNRFRIKSGMTIIRSENLGYAHGVNLGLKKALNEGFKYFCIINLDTYFREDFVQKTLSSIINHQSSIIGGKIYYAPGFEYHKERYEKENLGKVIWYAGGGVDWKNTYTIHRGVDKIDKGQYDRFEKTEFVTGCLICFDKDVIEKIGFWDEKYFLYYEDADFCERAKRKGVKLYCDPSIVIWHKNAQSTGGSGSDLHKKHQERNRLRFGFKYAPLKTKFHLLKNYLIKEKK